MPTNTLEFRVVLASPSDVFEQRKTVLEALQELSKSIDAQGASVRCLNWEEYASPGAAGDAQELINKQLLKEYDLLIALFGTKIGAPTQRHKSGTIEEVENALAKTDSAFREHRLQVYFQDDIRGVTSLDIKQLAEVHEYRSSLSSRGVLYSTFSDISDLAQKVRINTHRAIQTYFQNSKASVEGNDEVPAVSQSHSLTAENDEDEPGLMDLIGNAVDFINASSASVNSLTDLMNELATETNARVDELEKMADSSLAERKALINKFADFMKNRAAKLKAQALSGKSSFESGIDSLITFFELKREYEDDAQYVTSRAEILDSAEILFSQVASTKASAIGLRQSTASLPRITIQFNQAKRQMLDALDTYIEMIEATERQVLELTART